MALPSAMLPKAFPSGEGAERSEADEVVFLAQMRSVDLAVTNNGGTAVDREIGATNGERCSPLRFTVAAGDREIAPTSGEQCLPLRLPRAIGRSPLRVASNARRYGTAGDREIAPTNGEQCSPLRFTVATGDREIGATNGEQCSSLRENGVSRHTPHSTLHTPSCGSG